MSVNDMARYLGVSRQNLAGVIGRMERDGHIYVEPDERDRRSRLIKMTESGQDLWLVKAQPKIYNYYAQALAEFSVGDLAHALHYLLKLYENMKHLDQGSEDLMAAVQDDE